MSRNLAKLLGNQPSHYAALLELRRMTRDDSDVRLLADILAKAHDSIRFLGLTPGRVHAEELYKALQAVAPRAAQLAPFQATNWVLLAIDGHIISFHPADIVDNYHHELPLGRHSIAHGQRGLGHEIMRRYRQHPCTYAPAVERVVCDGGICWWQRDEAASKRQLAKNFRAKQAVSSSRVAAGASPVFIPPHDV